MNKDELEWWLDIIHDYVKLEELKDAELRRLILCCLEFILKSLAEK
jgi:hypothetical protein